jgi:hypothetical protein
MVPEDGDLHQGDRELPESGDVAIPDRFLHAIARAESWIARGATGAPADDDPELFAAYQEIVLLTIGLERETARILEGAAHLATDLITSALALQRKTGQASE